MDFEQTWQAIQTGLSSGMSVRNWTRLKGYLGDSFEILDVSPERIIVSAPAAKNEQHVPKRDFAKVNALWMKYCSGDVGRQEIVVHTRYSKYIISILHQILA